MEYGLVRYGTVAYHRLTSSYSTCKIAAELPESRTKSLWNESLYKMGFDRDPVEPTPQDLFRFVKAAFEQQKGVSLDIDFARGYVASLDGMSPIPSNEASRLYSGRSEIYVDELILAALFEYVATYYLWAKDHQDKSIIAFCFQYTAQLLNYTCRLGILSSDAQKAQLVEKIVSHCDKRAVNLIADLYWSCLAFGFCHEMAHIYLKHTEQAGSSDTLWNEEYEADAVGYEVYLQIIETVCEKEKDPFAGVFHDYLYVAPMVLFQFYADTYFMSYWLFGERAGGSHPPLEKRFDALLRISEQSRYTFETREGNILLNNYMDVSDWFREQLILKLQKGKLNQFIQKGVAFMSKSGYREAIDFQENMCADLRNEAEKYGLNSERLIGLWDTAVDIELLDEPSANAFVWHHKGKTYSIKAFNIRFSLKKVLVSVLEFGGTMELPDDPVKTVFFALLILYKILDVSTLELCEAHAAALIKCHELRADERPIKEEVLCQFPGVTSGIISELATLGCIQINEGMVRLNEEIYIC